MRTYNCGVVQRIGGREYELLSHKWHNPNYNIIATNVDIEGGKTIQICYNKSLTGNESFTLYWHKPNELGHYLSRQYADIKTVPTKYIYIIKDMMKAFDFVDFNALENPRVARQLEEDRLDLVVKIPNFKTDKNLIYCDVILRGVGRNNFSHLLKKQCKDRQLQVDVNDDNTMLRIREVNFVDLRDVLFSFMTKAPRIKIVSGVNLDNIPNNSSKMLVIDTFKRVSNNVG